MPVDARSSLAVNRGALYAALAAIFYGSAYAATAIALHSFTPVSVAVWRGLLGTLLLALALLHPAAAALRPPRLGRAALLRLIGLGVVGGGIFILAMNAAVEAAGVTVTAFVTGLYAVMAALLAVPMLAERLERRTLVALLAALAGTFLLSDLQLGEQTWTGIGIALVAAAAFGLFLVLSRRWSGTYRLSGPTVGLATLSASAALAVLVLLVNGDPLFPPAPRPDALAALGWLAAAPGAAASVLIVLAMRRLPARRASVFLLLNPPTAAVLAVLLLGERLSGVQLVGAGGVLAAIAFASGLWPTRRAARRSSSPGSEPPLRS